MRDWSPGHVLFKPVAAAIAALVFVLAPPVLAQQSTIGLTLGVQPWVPTVNDDTVKFLYNNPSAVSDALNNGWNQYQPALTTLLAQALGQPNLITNGVTLYNIDLRLTQPALTIEGLHGSGSASDPFQIALRILLQNEGLTATSTTPTKLGSYADPRCSLVFDAAIDLTVTVQNVPGAAVLSDQTDPDSPTIFNVTHFDFDSNNAPCDVLVDALKVTGLKTVISNMVTNPNGPVSKPLNKATHGLLKQALDMLDVTIAPYQKSQFDLVALHAWMVNNGGGQQIVLNLAPRIPIPDPTAGQGRFLGSVKAGKPFGTDNGALDCGSLAANARRKTGPAPMINAQGALGDEPTEPLVASVQCNFGTIQPGETGQYAVVNISRAFPALVDFQTTIVHCGYKPGRVSGVSVTADGWTEDQDILPQNLPGNYVLSAGNISYPCAGVATHAFTPYDLVHRQSPGDPYPGEKGSPEQGQANPGNQRVLDHGVQALPPGQQAAPVLKPAEHGSVNIYRRELSHSAQDKPSSLQTKPSQTDEQNQERPR